MLPTGAPPPPPYTAAGGRSRLKGCGRPSTTARSFPTRLNRSPRCCGAIMGHQHQILGGRWPRARPSRQMAPDRRRHQRGGSLRLPSPWSGSMQSIWKAGVPTVAGQPFVRPLSQIVARGPRQPSDRDVAAPDREADQAKIAQKGADAAAECVRLLTRVHRNGQQGICRQEFRCRRRRSAQLTISMQEIALGAGGCRHPRGSDICWTGSS